MSHAMRGLSTKETKIYLKRDIKYFQRNMSQNIIDKERRVMKICPDTFFDKGCLNCKSRRTDLPSVTKCASLFHSQQAINLGQHNIRK